MAQAALDQAINQRSVGSLEGLGDFWRVASLRTAPSASPTAAAKPLKD
ncbi:MAG: hypothetical protein ACOYW9_14430 [Deinococcota bacterium]